MMAPFTLILRKSPVPNRGKSRKPRRGNQILTTPERPSPQPTPSGINHLPLPSESSFADAGRQAVAARLLELAQAQGMGIRASTDLHALLTALKIGEPIPIPAFAVVAEILFVILQANQHPSAAGETS